MSIDNFILLSEEFSASCKRGKPDSAMAEQLIDQYKSLPVKGKLHLMGLIMHNDYVGWGDGKDKDGRDNIRSYEDTLRSIEFVYQADTARDKMAENEMLEKAGISSPQPSKKNPLNRCIPVFLALDLAHEFWNPQPANP